MMLAVIVRQFKKSSNTRDSLGCKIIDSVIRICLSRNYISIGLVMGTEQKRGP